jgi:hypothetical protein
MDSTLLDVVMLPGKRVTRSSKTFSAEEVDDKSESANETSMLLGSCRSILLKVPTPIRMSKSTEMFNCMDLSKAIGVATSLHKKACVAFQAQANHQINDKVSFDCKWNPTDQTLSDCRKAVGIGITADELPLFGTHAVENFRASAALTNLICGTSLAQEKRPETNIVSKLVRVIPSTCFPEFRIGEYRVDLYVPEYRLIVEIDEHGHQDRKADHEIKRERDICQYLPGCAFYRFDPYSPNFDIDKVIRGVMHLIVNQVIAHHVVTYKAR